MLFRSRLTGADLRGSDIGGMHLDAQDLRGAIIDSRQAVQAASLLGLIVREPGEEIEEEQ